jgi:hypothetical protein
VVASSTLDFTTRHSTLRFWRVSPPSAAVAAAAAAAPAAPPAEEDDDDDASEASVESAALCVASARLDAARVASALSLRRSIVTALLIT